MNFKDKIKEKFNEVSSKMGAVNSELAKVVKENHEMLDANASLSKESLEGIQIMKDYASKETPAIKDAFISISEGLESIEINRDKMVGQLREQFLAPIQQLLEEWKSIQQEIKEDNTAAKKLDSVKKDNEKVKSKPANKKKPGADEQSASKLQDANQKAGKEHNDVIEATAKFNENKITVLKDALTVLVDLQKDFYQTALDAIDQCKAKVEAIDIQEESQQLPGQSKEDATEEVTKESINEPTDEAQ
jgi:hypothetical protein